MVLKNIWQLTEGPFLILSSSLSLMCHNCLSSETWHLPIGQLVVSFSPSLKLPSWFFLHYIVIGWTRPWLQFLWLVKSLINGCELSKNVSAQLLYSSQGFSSFPVLPIQNIDYITNILLMQNYVTENWGDFLTYCTLLIVIIKLKKPSQ